MPDAARPGHGGQPAAVVAGVTGMATALPWRAGIGLKPQHFRDVLDTRPDIGFFEVHAENYVVDGGPFHHWLGRIREHYPLLLHGVGLSIGGAGPLDEAHLDRLAALIERYEPASFSEHLAWSSHGDTFFNDLLPVPYDWTTLDRVCRHVDRVEERLQRRLLLENPSTYVEFEASTMSETQFLREVLERTGCALLLERISNTLIAFIARFSSARRPGWELQRRHRQVRSAVAPGAPSAWAGPFAAGFYKDKPAH